MSLRPTPGTSLRQFPRKLPMVWPEFSRHFLFTLFRTPISRRDLRIVCVNRECAFTRDRGLPILAVDEPIYRRLPCFLIATVDKFASPALGGEVRREFCGAVRFDKAGFYGASRARRRSLTAATSLFPPDLVIQDELHLISGPLGTMVGLHESAIEALCIRAERHRALRPKIVASTATVRRAQDKYQALFARAVDSGFSTSPARTAGIHSLQEQCHRPKYRHGFTSGSRRKAEVPRYHAEGVG